jgi:hypothetical protein
LIPTVSERKQPKQFWREFYDWLENQDGYRKVKQWAKDFVKQHGSVDKATEAPRTKAKGRDDPGEPAEGARFMHQVFVWIAAAKEANCDMIISGNEVTIDGVTRKMSGTALDVAKHAHEGVELVMLDKDGVRAIRDVRYASEKPKWVEREEHVRKVAKKAGLFIGEERITKRIAVGEAYRCRIISTSRELAALDPNALLATAWASQQTGPFEVELSSGTVKVAFVDLVVLAMALFSMS